MKRSRSKQVSLEELKGRLLKLPESQRQAILRRVKLKVIQGGGNPPATFMRRTEVEMRAAGLRLLNQSRP